MIFSLKDANLHFFGSAQILSKLLSISWSVIGARIPLKIILYVVKEIPSITRYSNSICLEKLKRRLAINPFCQSLGTFYIICQSQISNPMVR